MSIVVDKADPDEWHLQHGKGDSCVPDQSLFVALIVSEPACCETARAGRSILGCRVAYDKMPINRQGHFPVEHSEKPGD